MSSARLCLALLFIVGLAGSSRRAYADDYLDQICTAAFVVEVEVSIDRTGRAQNVRVLTTYENDTGLPIKLKTWFDPYRRSIPDELRNPALPAVLRRLYERAIARGYYRRIVIGTAWGRPVVLVVPYWSSPDSRVEWIDHPGHTLWWHRAKAALADRKEMCSTERDWHLLPPFRRFDIRRLSAQ